MDGSVLPAGVVGKCLGYWWKSDLLATKSVEENITKVCRTFFHYGRIGVFQGDISPLSSRSVLECCVMPILMFGSENWILTEGLIDRLEAFQGELVKRLLKWPKHHSNTAAITALDVPTMRSRLLVTKLGFLQRVMERDSGSLSGRVLEALCDDFESVCLVRECRELEESFETWYVDSIIGGSAATAREMKEEIFQRDRQKLLDRCREKAPVIAVVAGQVGWARLWDAALDFGGKTVRGMQMLTRVMSHHGRGSRPCPLCDDATLQSSVLDHILENHRGELFLEPELDTNQLLTSSEQLHLGFVAKYRNLYV